MLTIRSHFFFFFAYTGYPPPAETNAKFPPKIRLDSNSKHG